MPREEKNRTIAVVAYPGVKLLDLVATTTVLDRGTGHRAVNGGIDYEHIGAWAGTVRAGVSLAAPMIASKPKRLTRQNR